MGSDEEEEGSEEELSLGSEEEDMEEGSGEEGESGSEEDEDDEEGEEGLEEETKGAAALAASAGDHPSFLHSFFTLQVSNFSQFHDIILWQCLAPNH
jgi:hypothetical protein